MSNQENVFAIPPYLEVMRVKLFVGSGIAEHFLEIVFVLELFEVGVIGTDFGILEEFEDACARRRGGERELIIKT